MSPIGAFLVVFAGVVGLVIGSFLNVVVVRVPAGASLVRDSHCPNCDAPIRPWQNIPVISWLVLRGRCASCSEPISAMYPLVELSAGAAFAGVTWYLLVAPPYSPTFGLGLAATVLVTCNYLYLAAISIALTLIDIDARRLPNAVVLPSYAVAIGLFSLACLLGAGWQALAGALIGMAILYAFYWLLRLVRPGGMGGGDVKLAGLMGLYLGWIGWGALAVGAFAAFFFGGVFGIALLIARRAGRRTAIPFGPWIIAGAWTGIVAGESIGRGYMNLYTGG